LAATVLLVPLLVGGWASSASAGESGGLTLHLAERWNLVGRAGTWSPYVVTVRNDGFAVFTGEVALVPEPGFGSSSDFFARHLATVRVAPGTEITHNFSAQEPPHGYRAELRDARGTLLLRASPSVATRGTAAVAILSDVPRAGDRISASLTAHTRLEVGVSSFASAAAFPSDAIHLAGLNELVVDQFGAGTLSPAQAQAIEDFVGLGGTLIEAGGASWRRTLLPLPADLLPFRPTDTSTASMGPLGELVGVATDARADVATGTVAEWGTTMLATPGGIPLIVEGTYGAGRVVELTFDPLAPPFDGQVTWAALAWGQAIGRGLAMGPAGSGPGASSATPGYLEQVLSGSPAGLSPPFGLLIALLVGYVLVVSVLSYAVLRRVGRAGLLWVTVPALAIAVSAGAYVVGFGPRGQDYQVAEVQLQRLGPGGVVETDRMGGVFAPRRGDVRVTAPPNTLISTYVPMSNSGDRDAVLTAGPAPEVLFTNVAIWDLRPLRTLSVTHPFGRQAGRGLPIDAQLRLSQGRIRGQVVNRTARPVHDLELVAPGNVLASLGTTLAPGATLTVDAPMTRTGTAQAIPVRGVAPPGVPASAVESRRALTLLAASHAISRPGELALVGRVDPIGTLLVQGERPARSVQAAVVQPIRLAATDSVRAVTPPARLISSFSSAASLDVYELQVPQGVGGQVGVSWTDTRGPPSALSAEVYDWSRRTWRPLFGASGTTVALTPGEIGAGAVRVRVHEAQPGQTVLSLTELP